MEERALHIVIVGHIDHGKSTLVGRLFYDTGSLPPEKFEEIKRISASQGKDVEFAYVMDHLEEERQQGITIDIAHTFFSTAKRRYVIIDAPGHKEFLKNMITGSSQAEAALLLVDISRGIQDQTRRHCYILSLLGIRQVAVLVNKMDMVDFSENAFLKFKKEIEAVLGGLHVTPSYILPIAAKSGENVSQKTQKLVWFQGPTVLETLDSFSVHEVEGEGLRFPVQDVYELAGGSVAVGRVEAGVIKRQEEVYILPSGRKSKLLEIKKFMQNDLAQAPAEDCVGLHLDGEAPRRGDIIVDRLDSTITDILRAHIFWMVDHVYQLGIPLVLKCATQEVRGKIARIYKRFDATSIDVVESDAKEIRQAEIAEVDIKLEKSIVVDKFNDIPEMGRFVLEHAGHPVAGGIIL